MPGVRHSFLRVCVALAFLLASVANPAAAAASGPGQVGVDGLSVDHMVDPLGIDNGGPRFGWILRSTVNGERQAAYQVVVASSPERLQPGDADVWDSGRVDSADSVDVAFAGHQLVSGQRYYWTVRVWDANGRVSAWGRPAWFETGLLSGTDWGGAQWISPLVGDSGTWADHSIDLDFTIASGAAGVIFRAAGPSDFYLWQVNIRLGNSVLLRPHVRQGGNWRVLKEVPLDAVIPMSDATKTHHLTVSALGPEIRTFVDGTLVDTTSDGTFTAGTIGFRSGDGFEDARYDNVVVRGGDGKVLFSDDFSAVPDPHFPNARIESGALRTANGDVQIMSSPGPAAPLLRKDFMLADKKITSARAYAYGLGWYELRLSGRKVGDRVLAPSATPFASRNLYQTYDVTDQLRGGWNTLGVWLADGYGPTFSQYGWRWFGPRQAIVKLDVRYADGTTTSVVSDETWRWSDGPITSAHIYNGETYDARLDRPGWDSPGYDDAGWRPVHAVIAPSPRLLADTAPPIRVTDTLRPIASYEPRPGVHVFDLGQNIAGWVQLRVAGERGTVVRIRHAEAINADHTLDTFTNRAAQAVDTYILAGTGATETYEPRFTYHGFRYVEVTGLTQAPTLDTISGRAVHADVRQIGSFASSDPMLNKIHANLQWTMLNNSMSYPTDTAVRDERTPPGMDVQAYQDAATRDFGMDRFYAKYLQDTAGGGGGGSPEMNGAYVSLAWTLYEQYGDLATLASTYPAMTGYVDSLAAKAPDGIWPEGDGFGDWCPPVPPQEANGGLGGPNVGGYGACMSEISAVNSALYFRLAEVVSLAAAALGQKDDAARYRELAGRIKDGFNAHFLNEQGNGYGSGRQVTSILPLAFGMVPQERRPAVGAELVRTILDDNGGHLDTGIFGTRYLVDALVAAGRPDVALTVLRQDTYPSFGAQIALGATTAWEEWTYRSGMHTYDHAMFAGIDASFYSRFAGIEPAAPGYQRITIRPAVPAGLDHVSARIDTVRGEVASAWRVDGRVLNLDVNLPVNSTAEVWVPLRPGAKADPSSVSVREDGTRFLRIDGGYAVFAAESGTYHFNSH